MYDPNAVISDYYITDHDDNVSRNVVLSINSTLLQNVAANDLSRYWYKDGIRIDDGDVNITYDNGLVYRVHYRLHIITLMTSLDTM